MRRGSSQKLNPILKLLSVWELFHILLRDESEPVHFGDTVIVVVVAFLDLWSRISLDDAIDEILAIALFHPFHLFQYAMQEIIGELVIIGDIISLIINESIYIKVRFGTNELDMLKILSLNVWQAITNLSDN